MSATQRRKMHVNSLAAYQAGDERMFSVRELSVLGAVGRLRVASDREVMVALGFSDMNAVRPRITELVDDGVLEEVCSKEDPVTRKTVRVVGIRNREDKQAELPLFGG